MEAKDTKFKCLGCGQLVTPTQNHPIECCESFKAGIKEGIRRAYEDMKALHRIADYNLDACVEYLEEKYGKPSSRNGA